MADDKKPSGPSGPLQSETPWEFLIVAGILVLIISYALMKLTAFIQGNAFLGSLNTREAYNWFWAILPFLQILSFLVSGALVYAIVSTVKKLTKINKEYRAVLYRPADAPPQQSPIVAPNPAARKWVRILEHIESANPNDWKIAIIEADSILDELVDSMGYHGETLGEKLKAIEKSDFTTIDNAWEAHKVRNAIAHDGSNFQLNEREARRVIELYRTVFEEFRYI